KYTLFHNLAQLHTELVLDITLGVQAEYATVHRLARYRLKAKLKVPRPRSRKQDEKKLEAFKKTSVMTCN
ncbi:MAG: winged helix-turn-helix domain-containing protein, partial [Nostoc sp. NMS9]|nr:winged helix-turn-helix domain-containing protein [Nostoc sp. NMS9]